MEAGSRALTSLFARSSLAPFRPLRIGPSSSPRRPPQKVTRRGGACLAAGHAPGGRCVLSTSATDPRTRAPSGSFDCRLSPVEAALDDAARASTDSRVSLVTRGTSPTRSCEGPRSRLLPGSAPCAHGVFGRGEGREPASDTSRRAPDKTGRALSWSVRQVPVRRRLAKDGGFWGPRCRWSGEQPASPAFARLGEL